MLSDFALEQVIVPLQTWFEINQRDLDKLDYVVDKLAVIVKKLREISPLRKSTKESK